jgi:hypothetical protein
MDLNIFGQGLGITSLKTEPKRPSYTKESLAALHHSYLETLPSFQDLVFHLKNFYEEKSSSKITR